MLRDAELLRDFLGLETFCHERRDLVSRCVSKFVPGEGTTRTGRVFLSVLNSNCNWTLFAQTSPSWTASKHFQSASGVRTMESRECEAGIHALANKPV